MTIVTSPTQNDIVNLFSTDARLKTLTVNTGGGNDQINLGTNLSGVGGLGSTEITIDAGSGSDWISADDRARAGTTGYLVNSKGFLSTTFKKLYFNNLERFDLWGSSTSNSTYNCFAALIPVNIHAGSGNDTVMTGSGNDSVWGAAGYDNIWTNGGNDWIDGGTGSDYLSGGAGADTVSYATRMNSVYVDLNNPATVNGESAEFDTLVGDFENVEGGYGNDKIYLRTNVAGAAWGNGGGDTLIGGNGNDHLYGGAGLDLLKGMAGNDTLDGGERTDSLAGGAGDDVLIMNDGEKDYYDGGTGTNTFSKDAIDAYKPIP
jgi:Ca2+-binding RTX toxin-like protein